MGRLDFRPQRVHQAVTELLKTPRLRTKPVWHDVVGRITPAQTLIRTLPVMHRPRRLPRKVKKPSKMFQPQNIVYPEDYMRERFYSDHPWELARPRIVLEDDGMDAQRNDWSRLVQPWRQTDGERCVRFIASMGREAWSRREVGSRKAADA
jgi:small subunit ribosomal protein S23